MPEPTPGYVKNVIRRSLREVIDPSPTKKDATRIWEYFGFQCAYCGTKLKKNKKEGHIDHLVPFALNGANHISNRVLSCATCNEKEKLDMPWEKFLASKNRNKITANRRKDKIIQWRILNNPIALNETILNKISSLANEIVDFYEKKIEVARELRALHAVS